MKPTERLADVARAIAEHDKDGILDPSEAEKITADLGIPADRAIPFIIYAKARLVDRLSMTKAFEKAFPDRCVATGSEGSDKFSTKVEKGEQLSRATIKLKARRVESSQAYKKIYTLLQTSLYVSYAVERLQILDEAFRLAMSEHTSDREKPQYMKLFLEETRKPAEAMKMELNMQVTQNNISVVDVENKMSDIAKRLDGMDASKIIEMVHNDRRED